MSAGDVYGGMRVRVVRPTLVRASLDEPGEWVDVELLDCSVGEAIAKLLGTTDAGWTPGVDVITIAGCVVGAP